MSTQFHLTTPKYQLRTRGIAQRIFPSRWDGVSVANAINTALTEATKKSSNGVKPIIIGLVPFNTKKPAEFYIPEEINWTPNPSINSDNNDPPIDSLKIYGSESHTYKASVAEALKRIHTGKLDKVVLARRVIVEANTLINSDHVYSHLCAHNKNAYVYRFDLPHIPGQPNSVMLGASPELLLRNHHGQIQSLPLAGSAPRLPNTLEDQEIAQALLKSKKDRVEHSLVVKSIGETFRQFADKVNVPIEPQLIQTPVIWHLGTHITGILQKNKSPIELAYALHPTPAVGGWPYKAAQDTITELEDFDRGFYSGFIGWMNSDGDGEWILALRCGIITENTATVFAGAGIVAGSDPEKEHAETSTKLCTFINALN